LIEIAGTEDDEEEGEEEEGEDDDEEEEDEEEGEEEDGLEWTVTPPEDLETISRMGRKQSREGSVKLRRRQAVSGEMMFCSSRALIRPSRRSEMTSSIMSARLKSCF